MPDGTLKNLAISIGFNTEKFAKGIQNAGAMMDSGFRKAAEGAREELSAGMKALHELGQRSTAEIQAAIDRTRASYEAIRADASLTDRDKSVALSKAMEQIRRLEGELANGIPRAAQQGFNGAGMAVNRFGGVIRTIWSQVAGPLAGVFAIGGSISSYISKSVEAGKLAEDLKVDVEELQVWSGAVERAGGTAEGLRQTIQKLTASGKDNGDAFGVLYDLAEKSNKMTKEAFIQKAKSLEIDEKTIEVLYKGRKELDENLKRQWELGVYTKQDAENSKKFKQAMGDLGQAFNSFISFIGRAAIPIMQKIADILTDVVIFIRQHTSFIVIAATLIGSALSLRLLPPLKQIPVYIRRAWDAFKKWGPLIIILTAIAVLLDDFYTYLVGGESELEEFWKIFGSGEEILATLTTAWANLKQWGTECIIGILRWIKQLWQTLEKWGVINDIKDAFMGLGHLIHGVFTKNWDEALEGAKNLFAGIFKAGFDMAKGLGKAFWDFITGAFEKIMAWLREKFTLKNVFGGLGELAKELAEAEGEDMTGIDGRAVGEKAAEAVSPKKKSPEEAAKAAKAAWEAGDEEWDAEKMFNKVEPEAKKAGEAAVGAFGEAGNNIESGMNATAVASGQHFVNEAQKAAAQIQVMYSQMLAGISAQIGNLAAGAQMMGMAGGMMVPAAAGVRAMGMAGGTVNNSTSSVNINNMTINSRATNANGIARDMNGALQKNRVVQAAQSGGHQK